jgi:hypothetical protein
LDLSAAARSGDGEIRRAFNLLSAGKHRQQKELRAAAERWFYIFVMVFSCKHKCRLSFSRVGKTQPAAN